MNKSQWLKIAKWFVGLLVMAGIVYTIWKSLSDLDNSSFSWSNFQFIWLLPAAGFYFASMGVTWIYWHVVLVGMGQHPELGHSFRAFLMGQLGKYFPGKALVVVIRTSAISGPRVQPAVAATSVFIETLTYMSVGAGVASVFMLLFVDVGPWLLALGIGAVLLSGIPIFPPVFRLLVRLFRIDKLSPKIGNAVANLKTRTALIGWGLLPISWILVGFSLWSVIRLAGIDVVSLAELPRVTSCAALAIVAGFLSMMPGGLGVRELVLVALLNPVDPVFDSRTTLVIAVTLRLCWLLTELTMTTFLKVSGFAKPETQKIPTDSPTG